MGLTDLHTRTLAIQHEQLQHQVALCSTGLQLSCPRSGAAGVSQCGAVGLAASCTTDLQTANTVCAGKSSTRTVSVLAGTPPGLQISYTGGDDGRETSISIRCDKSATAVPTAFDVNTTASQTRISFLHKSGCTVSVPPAKTILDQCFDAGLAGRVCAQVNSTGCFYTV